MNEYIFNIAKDGNRAFTKSGLFDIEDEYGNKTGDFRIFYMKPDGVRLFFYVNSEEEGEGKHISLYEPYDKGFGCVLEADTDDVGRITTIYKQRLTLKKKAIVAAVKVLLSNMEEE